MPLGKKSLAELRECLASWTLKEIRDLFESEDIPFSENYKSPHTGQRRSLADSYLVSINLSNHDDAGRVLKAFEHVLVKLIAAIEDNSGTSTAADAERSLKNLLRWLQRDGFDFENGRLAAVGTRTSEVPVPVMPKQEAVTEPHACVFLGRPDSVCVLFLGQRRAQAMGPGFRHAASTRRD